MKTTKINKKDRAVTYLKELQLLPLLPLKQQDSGEERGAILGLLFVYFWSFSNKQHKIYNKLMWKIDQDCQDLNSQPFDYESTPLTTRPGLPPKNVKL